MPFSPFYFFVLCVTCFLIGRIESFSVAPAPQRGRAFGVTKKQASQRPQQTKPTCIFLKRNIIRPEYKSIVSMPASQQPLQDKNENGVLSKLIKVIGSTTAIVVAGTFFAILAYKRDALMVSFFFGAIANAILSKVLKRLLNQDRPQDALPNDNIDKPTDKGMPSSHAMSLGFIGTFTGLQLPQTRLAIFAYVMIALAYRIKTKLHTWQQVAVGLVAGAFNGAVWKLSVCNGNNPFQFNLLDWTTKHLLNAQGVLPVSYMAVPLLVGALVVGSVERRISRWMKTRDDDEESKSN